MVAISFSVFRDKLISGEKRQTIRRYTQHRYNQIRKANELQIYWKQRTPECELLFRAELTDLFIIYFIRPVIRTGLKSWKYGPLEKTRIATYNGGRITLMDDIQTWKLARADGFNDEIELFTWFYEHYKEGMFKQPFMVIRFKKRG